MTDYNEYSDLEYKNIVTEILDDRNLRYAQIFSYEEHNYTKPLLILLNENFNYFNIVYDIEEYDNSNVISAQKEELLKGTIQYEKSESKSKKNPELKNNNAN